MKHALSLEFFPPKTPEGAEKLRATRARLYALKPDFCSVTFGAGGSTQDGTLATVQEILAEDMAAAPHLSCIGQTRESIRQRLDAYRSAGVRRIVALRGDLPSGYGADITGEFRYASDLIAFIRAETGDYFTLEVAAYPETHPQARSPAADLDAFALSFLPWIKILPFFSFNKPAQSLPKVVFPTPFSPIIPIISLPNALIDMSFKIL